MIYTAEKLAAFLNERGLRTEIGTDIPEYPGSTGLYARIPEGRVASCVFKPNGRFDYATVSFRDAEGDWGARQVHNLKAVADAMLALAPTGR
jgi:hypothetical protein